MRQGKSPAVYIIITLNLIVFVMWFSRDPEFMAENFLVSWSAVLEGRYWVLLSSAFSHNMLWHLLINMLALKSFGSVLEQILGFSKFVKFYLVASVVSSLTHGLVSTYLIGDPTIAALGASGAVSGLVILFSFLFPREKILLFGIIPIPAMIGALAFVGLDIWGLMEQAKGSGLPIGHGAHLGGAITGIIFYFLGVRPRVRHINRNDPW